jgi:hypothetical protein
MIWLKMEAWQYSTDSTQGRRQLWLAQKFADQRHSG